VFIGVQTPARTEKMKAATRSRVWASAVQFHYVKGRETVEGKGVAVWGERKSEDYAGKFFARLGAISETGYNLALGKHGNFDGAKFLARKGFERFDIASTEGRQSAVSGKCSRRATTFSVCRPVCRVPDDCSPIRKPLALMDRYQGFAVWRECKIGNVIQGIGGANSSDFGFAFETPEVQYALVVANDERFTIGRNR
jgi:hypothetical protein